MKQSKLVLMAVLLVSAFVCLPNVASAVVTTVAPVEALGPDAAPGFTKKQSRKIERLEKRLEKMASKSKALDGISIDDDTHTWLIRWLVLWGLAIAIGIIASGPVLGLGFLALIGGLVALLGAVCFVIWLLKFVEAI